MIAFIINFLFLIYDYVLLTSWFFFIFSVRYYISDDYKKNYFRGLESHKDKTITYAKNLPTLKNDTDKILTYVENNNTSKKKYKFWDLLDND